MRRYRLWDREKVEAHLAEMSAALESGALTPNQRRETLAEQYHLLYRLSELAGTPPPPRPSGADIAVYYPHRSSGY